MNIADFTLYTISGITRNIPYFPGLYRIYKTINNVMIRLGAQPLVTITMKNGTTMLVDLRAINTEVDAFYRGQYDSSLIEAVCSVLNPQEYFMDIGANIGFYSVAIATFIKNTSHSGRVVAFEPFEGNYCRLLHNLRANHVDSLCSTYMLGLSNRSAPGVVTLREDFLNGSGTGNAAVLINEAFESQFQQVPIQLERLDDIWCSVWDRRKRLDIIKIDIEGHEDCCLQGGQGTIEEHRPAILMEINKPYYEARNVDLDERFMPLFPQRYSIYRRGKADWTRIDSFEECNVLDNVFAIPMERLNSGKYRMFR